MPRRYRAPNVRSVGNSDRDLARWLAFGILAGLVALAVADATAPDRRAPGGRPGRLAGRDHPGGRL